MNELLFKSTDPVHYVYLHRHPNTDEVLYVGSGRNERAYRSTTTGDSRLYGHRSKEHAMVLKELQLEGYLPTDWVEILAKQLTKSEACVIEQEHIRELRPRFNRPAGQKLLKMKDGLLEQAVKLRSEGLFYHQIAEKLEISTMAVWRGLNGKNKNSD